VTDIRPLTSASDLAGEPRIAVLLPCQDEERTVGQVVTGFREALPNARVFVYDNASTDDTAERARRAGALVRSEPRRGKGSVVGRMFADIDAEVYVMADGDGTYDPQASPGMIRLLLEQNLDMVVGCRRAEGDAFPRGHVVGNRLFNRMLRALFGTRFTDVFSGYRVLSRRFVKTFPVRFTGFEIETELTAHTAEIGLPYAEVSTSYRSRETGSSRKLRTLRDGLRITIAAVLLYKEMRPLRFFTTIALVLTTIAVALGAVVIEEFLETGLVLRLPTAVLSASIQIVAFICLTAGVILDSVCRNRREARRLAYLSFPPVRDVGEAWMPNADAGVVSDRAPEAEVDPEDREDGAPEPSITVIRSGPGSRETGASPHR
jgi:glycosyltransferase involved in cell wall biosynthesis